MKGCWNHLFKINDSGWDELSMKTSSNGNIFRVTGLLCGEPTVTVEFPSQRPVMQSFVVFLDLRLSKRLTKQPTRRWFGTQSRSLWRHFTACSQTGCPWQSDRHIFQGAWYVKHSYIIALKNAWRLCFVVSEIINSYVYEENLVWHVNYF